MSENIENIEHTIKNETISDTQAQPAAGNNVVPYPVSDEQVQHTDEEAKKDITSTSRSAKADDTTDNAADNTADDNTVGNDTVDNNTADNDDDDDDLEEDFYEQQEKSRSKDEHPFREFFSNFRSKRKIEMNRDEQILSRISDEDLMEYLRMEQKRMELLQQAKEVREKRFWTTLQLAICLLSVILVIYFLKDNPVILVTILYTLGILTALRIWSKSQNGRDTKDSKDSSALHKKPWE